jgi:signal transduction histidine kinase
MKVVIIKILYRSCSTIARTFARTFAVFISGMLLCCQAASSAAPGLLFDSQGRLWVATANMRSWPITQAADMNIGTSWAGSYDKTRDGLLLFGGTLGVAIIDLSRFKPHVYAPPVVAVALSINGQATPFQVLPAWWQTPRFWVPALLLAGSILFGVFRWRVARLRAKARHLQRAIDARTNDILKLSKIGQELTATLDMEQAFERVYRQVFSRLDADVFAIALVNNDLIEFVYEIEHGQRLPNSAVSLADRNRPAVWCVREQRELITHRRSELGNYLETILPPLSGQPMETVVYLPLLAEQQVIGCLSVQSPKPYAYNEDQIEFLHILASYTAIAMSNSIAHRELTQSHKELTDALSYLQETQAKLIQAERQQLSLDLHDNLSQTMTGVLLQLDTARAVLLREQSQEAQPNHATRPVCDSLAYVDRAIELAYEGHAQTRQLLNALRSVKKKQHSAINLVDTLRRDLPRLTVGTSIVLEVQQEGQVVALNGDVELALFRIAQESVTNALRHGKAKKVVLVLAYHTNEITLSVQDDGVGFDPTSKAMVPGIGLMGMKERLAALGGRLSIDSAVGKGTCIRATLPLYLD